AEDGIRHPLVTGVQTCALPIYTGGSTGYASVTVSRTTVRYRVTLPTSALPSDLAEALRLAQNGSRPAREKLLDLLRTRITLRVRSEERRVGREGRRCSGQDTGP